MTPLLNRDEQEDKGWTGWNGGECPISPKVVVQTKWSDGNHDMRGRRADAWRWQHVNSGQKERQTPNLIAYRVVS